MLGKKNCACRGAGDTRQCTGETRQIAGEAYQRTCETCRGAGEAGVGFGKDIMVRGKDFGKNVASRAQNESVRRIRFSDREIEYVLTRKRVRNINLRIRTDGSVCVSASPFVPLSAIEAFILSKERYIVAALDRYGEFGGRAPDERGYADGEVFYYLGRELRLKVSSGDKNEVYREGDFLYLRVKNTDDRALRERTIMKWKDAESKRVLGEIVDATYPSFRGHGVPEPTLVFRDMKSRWGSCQPKNAKITLNKRLIGVPRDCIEYVVAHEFAHFLHPNHSKNFYNFLALVMPDWKERKKYLENTVLRKL